MSALRMRSHLEHVEARVCLHSLSEVHVRVVLLREARAGVVRADVGAVWVQGQVSNQHYCIVNERHLSQE